MSFYHGTIQGNKPVPLEKILKQADEQMEYDPDAGNEELKNKIDNNIDF